MVCNGVMEALLHSLAILVVVMATFLAVPLMVSPIMLGLQRASRARTQDETETPDNPAEVVKAA